MGKNRKSKELEGLELSFGQFWLVYPRKRARLAAFKSFKRIAPDEETLTQIIVGIMRYMRSGEWDDSRYIPYPATFLNQERWKDEVKEHGTAQTNSADQKSERNRQAIRNVLGRDSGLAGFIREPLGTDHRGVGSVLPDHPRRDSAPRVTRSLFEGIKGSG
jgi:hypothetical protein